MLLRSILITFVLCIALHSQQTYFQGKWKLTSQAIHHYGVQHQENFGIFNIKLPGKQLRIPDLLYHVHRNSSMLGIRVIPIKDHSVQEKISADGIVVPKYDTQNSDFRWGHGSQLVDDYYKQLMAVDDNAPIFAVAAYSCPSSQTSEYLTQNRITHLAAYIGKGRLRNAPVGYHNYSWQVTQYPAHLYSVSLKGVAQPLLNRNLQITLQLLNQTNYGPRFAEEYDYDWFATYNLKETLEFYRGWLDPSYVRRDVNQRLIDAGIDVDIDTPYQQLLLNESFLQTYCSEHVTIAMNCGVNIPQSEEGYAEIWGEEQGKKLFRRANELWEKIHGTPLPQQTQFRNPLWKRTMRSKRLIDHPLIEKPGEAMVWRPETSADLIADFIAQYAKFSETSLVYAASTLLKFAPEYQQRTGTTIDKYCEIAIQFIEKMAEEDFCLFVAKNNANLPVQQVIDAYFSQVLRGFEQALSDYPALVDKVKQMLRKVQTKALELMQKPTAHETFPVNHPILTKVLRKHIADKYKLTLEEIAWLQFCIAVHSKSIDQTSLMDLARNLPVKNSNIAVQVAKGEKYIQYYSSPSILHKITKGYHIDRLHPDIAIIPLATIFDYKEVTINNDYNPQTDNTTQWQTFIREFLRR